MNHGTHSGYVRGCRNPCCRKAHTLYMKLYRMGRRNTIVDPTGTRRRIQALLALGWYHSEISAHIGFAEDWSRDLLQRPSITSRNAFRIAQVYDALCMTQPPPHPFRVRAQNRARRHGHVSPLGWDDIDRDPAPTGVWRGTTRNHQGPSHDTIDEARILRILGGDYTLAREATNAERHQIVARWDGTLAELERRTGWKVDRYTTPQDEVA